MLLILFPFPINPPKIDKTNPAGLYRRWFTVPPSWKSKQIYLNFDGAESAFYLWINGKYVGYSEDSRTTASFDISPYLIEGKKNLIAVQLMKWCDGSYLEDQDIWRMNGIYRDVYLLSKSRQHISDIFIKTNLDSSYKNATVELNTTLNNKTPKAKSISYSFTMSIKKSSQSWKTLLCLPLLFR